ncbi:MAG: helix-turn-helix transcriptional regulator [Flavobacteriales bacterium]|nr:helix-turn-helix transcriptional regulator [Flavobacteriales bacterium]
MDEEKPYLNGKLSLKEVAAHLDISVNHLSQMINEQLSKSFFDFVNEYRVKEVKKQLEELKYKEFTLLSIAHNSGFNSKSSFNSIFKKLTGFTPSEYISKI